MKKNGFITGIVLLLLIAGGGTLSAQSGMKDTRDSSRMTRPARGMGEMKHGSDSLHMRGHTNHMPMYGMRGGFRHSPRFGFEGEMAMGPGLMGHGRLIESIPNLTDNQKKEIADIRQNQANEINKFREETLAKMKSIRESGRSKILNLLNEEQKKYIESKFAIRNDSTPIPKE